MGDARDGRTIRPLVADRPKLHRALAVPCICANRTSKSLYTSARPFSDTHPYPHWWVGGYLRRRVILAEVTGRGSPLALHGSARPSPRRVLTQDWMSYSQPTQSSLPIVPVTRRITTRPS